MSEQKTKHSTQIDDIESICSDLLRNDSEIQFVMKNLYDSHWIMEEAADTMTFLNIWQNMLIETLAGIWIDKLYCVCKTSIDMTLFINKEAEDYFTSEIQDIIKNLPDPQQFKLKRFGVKQAVSKIFGILKPLNSAGAFWYSKNHLLRNKHLIQSSKCAEICYNNKFISTRHSPFNDLQQKHYDELLDYIDHASKDKSDKVYIYPPQHYQKAHQEFWINYFRIINTSNIVDSGRGLATKDVFIPENILCFYAGYLHRGHLSSLTEDQYNRALVLRKNKICIIAEASEDALFFPSVMNYYFTKQGNKIKNYNHFEILHKCPNQEAGQGKSVNLGFIQTQLDVKPNTECFLNYSNTTYYKPVKSYNQISFTDLHYEVDNKYITAGSYACRNKVFYDDKSSYYKKIFKEDFLFHLLNSNSNAIISSPLSQMTESSNKTISNQHQSIMFEYYDRIKPSITYNSEIVTSNVTVNGPYEHSSTIINNNIDFADNDDKNNRNLITDCDQNLITDCDQNLISDCDQNLNKVSEKPKNITSYNVISNTYSTSTRSQLNKLKDKGTLILESEPVVVKTIMKVKPHINKSTTNVSERVNTLRSQSQNSIINFNANSKLNKKRVSIWEDNEEVDMQEDEDVSVIFMSDDQKTKMISPQYANIKFTFKNNEGKIRFSNYNLQYLSRVLKSEYTDIFIIIGIDEIYKEINALIAVGASCFSKTQTISYLCNKIDKLKIRSSDEDEFVHLFADKMINQLNNSRNKWILFSAYDSPYGEKDNCHMRTIVTVVTSQKLTELKHKSKENYDLGFFTSIKEHCQQKLFVQRPIGFCHDTNVYAIGHLINDLQINSCSICLEFGCGYPILSCCLAMISKNIVDAVDIDETIAYIFQTINILTNSENEFIKKFQNNEEDSKCDEIKNKVKTIYKRIKLKPDDLDVFEYSLNDDEKSVSSDSSSSSSMNSSLLTDSNSTEDNDSEDLDSDSNQDKTL